MTENITKQDFIDKVYDFENETEWKYKGELPAIIDFYADWCGPCRMVSPVLEKLSEEYEGKINIYKVNTEKEQDLSAAFGISSIPAILFIPKDEKPQMTTGALPKETFKQVIKDVLMVE